MTALGNRVFRKLEKRLPSVRVCGGILVIAPTGHIMRGFALAKTRSARHDLFGFVRPLYKPSDELHFTYGSFIPNSHTGFDLSNENLDEMADQIAALIMDGRFSYLQSIREPGDFLDHFGERGPQNLPHLLDIGLSYYMLGDLTECRRVLEKVLSESVRYITDGYWEQVAADLLDDLRIDPARAANKVRLWERKAIEKMKLEKTMIGGQ